MHSPSSKLLPKTVTGDFCLPMDVQQGNNPFVFLSTGGYYSWEL